MNPRTRANATKKEMKPELIASLPSVGPTIVSEMICVGAGNLPDFKILESHQLLQL